MKLAGIASALGVAMALAHPALADQHAPLIAQGCAGCHGQAGEGVGAISSIAGYNRDDFLEVWSEFRAGDRPATIMTRIARGYTEDEVAELADYFSSLR